MNKYNKPILSVFRTYTDAYLEYVNNWISIESYCSFYSISEVDFRMLLRTVSELRANGGKWSELDYYFNMIWNTEYQEKTSIF